jgi:hypothetical protein
MNPASRCTASCSRIGRCPVCGAPNECREESGESYRGPCWCESLTLSAAALRRITADLPDARCLCPTCLQAIAQNPDITREELTHLRQS